MATMSGERDRAHRAAAPRPRGPITGAMERLLAAAAEPSAPGPEQIIDATPMVAVNPHLRRAAVPCKHCGARIVLAMLNGGRRIPIDLNPDPEGTVAIRVDHTFTIRARVLTHERDQLEGAEKLHVTHFATCGPRVADRADTGYRERARRAHREDTEEDDW